MQIIPIPNAGAATDFLSALGTSSAKDSPHNDFLQAIHKAIESVQRGDTPSVKEALGKDDTQDTLDAQNAQLQEAVRGNKKSTQSLVEGPYSRHTANGVTYNTDEVCFTKTELHELRAQLLKNGAPERSLKKFDVLADQPDGAMLAQIMASLHAYDRQISLSDDDKTAITAFLGKIDPTGDLAPQALSLMEQGKGQAAMQLIQKSVANLSPTESVEISKDDALALGRGLGLNKDSLQKLAANFGPYDKLRSTADQFSNLMAPATSQFADDAADQLKLDAAVAKTLQPIISKAKARMDKENAASALHIREVAHSKLLIDKTVQEESRAILDQTLQSGQDAQRQNAQSAQEAQSTQDGQSRAGKADAAARQSEAMSRKLGETQSPVAGPAGKSDDTAKNQRKDKAQEQRASHEISQDQQPASLGKAEERMASVSAQGASNAASARNTGDEALNQRGQSDGSPRFASFQGSAGQSGFAQSNSQDGSQNGAGKDENGRKDNQAWSELLSKVDAKAAPAAGPRGDALVYSMLHPSPEAAQTQEAAQSAAPQALSRQVPQQVEQGLLTSLKGGGTRLDLQLNPEQLGVINLTLTVRNGEVSAMIRSEKSETAEMVTRQLDMIKVNLEQQGVKVDKIEVQVNDNSQNNESGTPWQDLNQHNAKQEEDARREELARLRNLSTVRNSSLNIENETLEQPVHSLMQTARNATQSLHVVA